jgi:lambda family phage portal protein
MKIFDAIARRMGYFPGSHRRSYAAANINRLTADWLSSITSVDADIRAGLVTIRERARDLIKNNDIAKAYVRSMRVNVVGPDGLQLQMNVRKANGESDDDVNNRIEDAWLEWSERQNCSVSGQYSLRGVHDQLIQYNSRDGEGMQRIVRSTGSKFGIQLQIIEPEALDERKIEKLSETRWIKMGVLVNEWRRPLAYYLKKSNPELELYTGYTATNDHLIVPASELMHGFDREYVNQTRGISWMVQSMVRMKMLSGYEEAAVINARAAASKMGFFSDKPGTPEAKYKGDEEDVETGELISEISPGLLEDIGNKEFNAWDPKYPDQQHEMFARVMHRSLSSGLGISYMNLTGDLSQANYSSMRQGLLPERDNWRMLQNWFIEIYLKPVFPVWLESAIMSGALKKLSIANFDRMNKPTFVGRTWDWVDPEKDFNAKLAERRAGVTSLFEITAQKGRKLEDVFKDIADENKLAEKYGITVSFDNASAKTKPEAVIPPDATVTNAADETLKRSLDDVRKTQGELFASIQDIRENQNLSFVTQKITEQLSATVEKLLKLPREKTVKDIKRKNGQLHEVTILETVKETR